ncbi:MAG: HNH endonuclease signature motif containing protein [Reyranella sp.]
MLHVLPVTESGCWIWTGKGQRYGHVSVGTIKDGDRRTALAHRVSWELYRGPIPDGILVCHRCDVTFCVRPDHLFLGDAKANNADALSKGRRRSWRGANNPHSRVARGLS